MGHKTIQMTIRYAHLSPEFLAGAVKKLDRPARQVKPGREQGLRTKVRSLGSHDWLFAARMPRLQKEKNSASPCKQCSLRP